MDTDMLRILLDDSITYFGASKKVFIERLEFIFCCLKQAGIRSHFTVIRHKRFKNVYYLRLQGDGYRFKFIIDELDGRVINVYNNKKVLTSDDAVNISEFDLYFGIDERKGFVPSESYVYLLGLCNEAYNTLIHEGVHLLDINGLLDWLKRYNWLYQCTQEHFLFFGFKKFTELYSTLEFIAEYLDKYVDVKIALNSFSNASPILIEQWLVNYDRLFFCDLQGFDDILDSINWTTEVIRYHRNHNLYFIGDEFFSIYKFNRMIRLYYGFLSDADSKDILNLI